MLENLHSFNHRASDTYHFQSEHCHQQVLNLQQRLQPDRNVHCHANWRSYRGSDSKSINYFHYHCQQPMPNYNSDTANARSFRYDNFSFGSLWACNSISWCLQRSSQCYLWGLNWNTVLQRSTIQHHKRN